jgi:hypothetical protein
MIHLKTIARPYRFAALYFPDLHGQVHSNEEMYAALSGYNSVTIIPSDGAFNYGDPVTMPVAEFTATWQGD